MKIDVTDKVNVGPVDDECTSLTKCICGAGWLPWSGPLITIYEDSATKCPNCGRRYFFVNAVRVFQVVPDNPHLPAKAG